MSPSPSRTRALSCAVALAASATLVGLASAASGKAPGPGDPGSGASARPANPGNGGGNGGGNSGGNGGGNGGGSGGGNGGGRNPIVTPPAVPTPPTPVAPGSPAAPRNPIAPGNGGGSGNGGSGAGGGGNAGAPGAAAPGGTRTSGGSATAPTVGGVPRNVPTSGFRAGRGTASVSYFVDLGDLPSASSHLAVVPTVLARLTAESLGTITLRPLMTGRDANSTEAACALVAASQQNRAWIVASALATARTTTDGDWLGVPTLRSIGRRSGMSVTRFVKGATGRACYRQLAAVRDEARGAGVGSSPAYVVKGPAGTRVVLAPGSADAVVAAIAAVS